MRKPTVIEVVLLVVILAMCVSANRTNQKVDDIDTMLTLMGMSDDATITFNGRQLNINDSILDRVDSLEAYTRAQSDFNENILAHLSTQTRVSW